MQRRPHFSRRDFLKSTTAGVALLSSGVWSQTARAASRSVQDKLNIACIGTANRAHDDINELKNECIVAVVDVDSSYLDRAGVEFPDARKYADYREMIEKEVGKIDAVMVGTPDHHHAPAAIRAIRAGLHTYCEKPLDPHGAGSAHPGRSRQETWRGHAARHTDPRRTELSTMSSRSCSRRDGRCDRSTRMGRQRLGRRRTTGRRPGASRESELGFVVGCRSRATVLAGIYHPANWRRWWDFGQGTLGDMGCHYMDLAFWALKLRHPTRCAAEGPAVHPETCPLGLIVRYEFPERDGLPPVKLTWYDGDLIPKTVAGEPVLPFGVMFVGTEGHMFADYSRYRLFPSDKFSSYKPPEHTIPESIGHHAEWIKACKEGTPTTCNFDYSGALTETVLLGNIAYRTGVTLEWDAANLKATNCPEADKYISKTYRPGWEVA